VQMPFEDHFHDFPCFAETLLHEVGGHWTEHRLGWSGSYPEGELRAEITACFLSAALGIPNGSDLTNHAKYLDSWLQSLANDPKYLFRASSAASKAADYFLSFGKPNAESVADAELEAVGG